jgi:hypothetical protein
LPGGAPGPPVYGLLTGGFYLLIRFYWKSREKFHTILMKEMAQPAIAWPPPEKHLPWARADCLAALPVLLEDPKHLG